jgi:hypothetical protein
MSGLDLTLVVLIMVVLAIGCLIGWLACLAWARNAFSTYDDLHELAHDQLGLKPPKAQP